MTSVMTTAVPADPECSEAEWAVRVDLAAAYRLAALYGWDDGLATHFSARVPGEETFLINPYGLFFAEVTASNLVKIDLDGNVLAPTRWEVNRAGFVIHGAIHEALADAMCVMHLHTQNGVAVSCLEEGLLPLSQAAMLISDRVAYHSYEGVALDEDERPRLIRDLGEARTMILRNHGTLTVGSSVAAAFHRMFALERACDIQMRILAAGRPISRVSNAAQARTGEFGQVLERTRVDLIWQAHRRALDRVTTDYQQ
jgi:ribulose-5-phosphate 4-epimerase/fuculose-1-phosphate aldolase